MMMIYYSKLWRNIQDADGAFCGGDAATAVNFKQRDAEDVVPYKQGAMMNFVGVGVPDNPRIYGNFLIKRIP